MLIIQKRFKLAWVWLVGNLILLGFYSYWGGFTSSFTYSLFSISSLNDLARIGLFFISFLGSMFSFENQTVIFTFGIIMVCHFIFLIYKRIIGVGSCRHQCPYRTWPETTVGYLPHPFGVSPARFADERDRRISDARHFLTP